MVWEKDFYYIGIILVFVAGIMIGAFTNINSQENATTTQCNQVTAIQNPNCEQASSATSMGPVEIASPPDRISEDKIRVTSNGVYLDIKDAGWARFTDTNSMDPVIDDTSNTIEIIPAGEDDIQVGDIISYKSQYADGIIIHRVINIGNDSEGKYFILKGDNNKEADPGKVRFSEVQRVVVAIIY